MLKHSFSQDKEAPHVTGYNMVPRRSQDDEEPTWQRQAPAEKYRPTPTVSISSPYAAASQSDQKTSRSAYINSISSTGYTPGPPKDVGHVENIPKVSNFSFETIAADVAAICIPLALLAFAVVVWCRDRQEASDEHIETWRNVASVLSTLFPVLFAAVLGRLMTQAARWKLEAGSTLQSLEQLLGSRTVGGAVLSPLHLQTFNLLAVGLLLLWVFSPLGAQAMLRIVEPRASEFKTPNEIGYYDTQRASRFTEIRSYFEHETARADLQVDIMGALYSSLLLAPMTSKDDVMDPWGNVKIPLLSPADSSNEAEWISVPEDDTIYSALVGVPLVNMTTGNTTLSIESTYMEVSCDRAEVKMDSDVRNATTFFENINQTALQNWHLPQNSGLDVDNGTFQSISYEEWDEDVINGVKLQPWSISADRLIDEHWATNEWLRRYKAPDPETLDAFVAAHENTLKMFENETDIDAGLTRLLLQAVVPDHTPGGDTTFIKAHCDVTQSYIESEVSCQKRSDSERGSCRVVRQRPSQKPHATEEITYLSFPDTLYFVSRFLPRAGGKVRQFASHDLTLQYLLDPKMPNALEYAMQSGGFEKFDEIDEESLSRRLTQVLNTYIHISQMHSWITGNIPDTSERFPFTISEEVDMINYVTRFHVPKVWIVLCIFSCLLLLAGGVGSVLFAHLATTPEVLGYASTAIRDNKYMLLDKEVSGMEGAEVTSALKGTRVRYGVMRGAAGERVGVGLQESVSRVKDVLRARRGED